MQKKKRIHAQIQTKTKSRKPNQTKITRFSIFIFSVCHTLANQPPPKLPQTHPWSWWTHPWSWWEALQPWDVACESLQWWEAYWVPKTQLHACTEAVPFLQQASLQNTTDTHQHHHRFKTTATTVDLIFSHHHHHRFKNPNPPSFKSDCAFHIWVKKKKNHRFPTQPNPTHQHHHGFSIQRWITP